MKISSRFCRLSLFAGAAIFGAIALMVATMVIPPVMADTFPPATPQRATMAFSVIVLSHLLITAALFSSARRITDTSRGMTGLLISLAVLALLFALAFVDAAGAFEAHGPALQTSVTFIRICMAAELLAAVLLITMVFLLRKRA